MWSGTGRKPVGTVWLIFRRRNPPGLPASNQTLKTAANPQIAGAQGDVHANGSGGT